MTDETILRSADLLGDIARFLRNRDSSIEGIKLAIKAEAEQKALVDGVATMGRERWIAARAAK